MLPVAEVSDWLPAVAGLIGVLIGGGITYVIEGARDQRQREREAEKEAAHAQALARVARDDLNRAAAVIGTVIESRRWWIEDADESMILATFDLETRRSLARYLTNQEWRLLTRAQMAIHLAAWRRKGAVDDKVLEPSDKLMPLLDEWATAIKDAANALRRLAFAREVQVILMDDSSDFASPAQADDPGLASPR